MNTTYVNVEVLNYRGEEALSGFTLPDSYFTLIPYLENVDQIISLKNIIWDFGDGTTSNELTATHHYSFPGIYTINLTVYNEDGSPLRNVYTPKISAYDYITDNLLVDAPSSFEVRAGNYQSFGLLTQNSFRIVNSDNSSNITINLYASGSLDPQVNISDYYSSQWSHLTRFCSFFKRQVAGNTIEYTPISAIDITNTIVYVNRDSAGEYQLCKSTDVGAIVAGSTGYATPYFTCDTPKNYTYSGEQPLHILASLESNKIVDSVTTNVNLSGFRGVAYHNTKPSVIPNVRVRYNPASAISFSTNGIDTQGDAILSTFNIPAISWQYTKIPFVAKLKSADNFATKFYPVLTANDFATVNLISLSAVSNNIPLCGTFYTDNIDNLPTNYGGYFKGYFITPLTATNVSFRAEVLITDPTYYSPLCGATIASSTRLVSGESANFDILPATGKYNIVKKNENFDFSNFLGNLRFADYQFSSDYFGNFLLLLSASLGSAGSQPYEFGKTVFEKIANFTDNNNNVDTANIPALVSLCKQVGFNLEDVNYEYPAQLRRVLDILSISHKKLFGEANMFNTDFSDPGISNTQISTNIGTELSVLTSTFPVSAGIVALEKYSGTYTLVYTAELSGISLGDTLPLSSYSYTWGWPLTLPESISGTEIGTFYRFYEYINSPKGDAVGSILDWNNSTLTISYYNSAYSAWSDDDGIMDNIINYELTKGLRLFTSAADITYNN